ncbi:MAG: hypothetical protein AB1589_37135 [Cyanobacteriota bacterium]
MRQVCWVEGWRGEQVGKLKVGKLSQLSNLQPSNLLFGNGYSTLRQRLRRARTSSTNAEQPSTQFP